MVCIIRKWRGRVGFRHTLIRAPASVLCDSLGSAFLFIGSVLRLTPFIIMRGLPAGLLYCSTPGDTTLNTLAPRSTEGSCPMRWSGCQDLSDHMLACSHLGGKELPSLPRAIEQNF